MLPRRSLPHRPLPACAHECTPAARSMRDVAALALHVVAECIQVPHPRHSCRTPSAVLEMRQGCGRSRLQHRAGAAGGKHWWAASMSGSLTVAQPEVAENRRQDIAEAVPLSQRSAAGVSLGAARRPSQRLESRRHVAPDARRRLLPERRRLEGLPRDLLVQQHVPPGQLAAQLRRRLGQHLRVEGGRGEGREGLAR